MIVTCLACNHVDNVERGVPFEDGIFRCGECGARMSYGKLMPHIAVKPYVDERGKKWLRRVFRDPKTKAELFTIDLDAEYALMEAKNVISLVVP